MRVGILTFPNSPSYGASLQMRGLYRCLESLGHNVEIINYKNIYMASKKHFRTKSGGVIKKIAISLLDAPTKYKFQRFEKKLDFYPKTILCEKDNLKGIAERYDYLICGSDQVWNPNITNEDMNYFFSFCEDNSKKISYAASFGVTELSEAFASKVREELQKFNYISVREEQGREIVVGLLDKECTVVLDPTMLLSQSEWKSCEKKNSKLPDKYIAKFIFNYDEAVERSIDELKRKTGLPLITVGGSLITKIKDRSFTGPLAPDEWLYVLDHAEYVVTDSFHGAAFSIIFHKKLFVSLASATNSRLKNLLHTFNLDNRVISINPSLDEIDYNSVQMRMEEKKEAERD